MKKDKNGQEISYQLLPMEIEENIDPSSSLKTYSIYVSGQKYDG